MTLALAALPTTALLNEFRWCLSQHQPAVVRSIEQWVEEEIVLPTGPFAHQPYRHSRHPASQLWFEAVGSGYWSRFAITGPQQNGKTLMGYVAPVLYHLFEIGETVIIGLPTMDMANDKWQQDFLPVIQASRYRDLLPTKGEGSKGGQVKRGVTFKNGATLRFMTAGGDDKKRAGFTSRVVAVTETDGMDESGESSREADKISQIEGRTSAFRDFGYRVYLECTVSIEKGRIWQEYTKGTESKIVRPCPHCGAWVTPEREHFKGWQQAESEIEAAENARFHCPDCDKPWTDAERWQAAEKAILLHRGQEITPDGEIVGAAPPTATLGFRWSAVDNPFASSARLGAAEWNAARAEDSENAEKAMRQFIWAIPYQPPDVDMTPLEMEQVKRTSGLPKGTKPRDCIGVAVQVDTGKRELHWEAKAITREGMWPVISYGRQEVHADRLGIFQGLLSAFRELRTYLESHIKPTQVWIDSAYHEHTAAVYALCAEANGPGKTWRDAVYKATRGHSEKQRHGFSGRYQKPTTAWKDVVHIGREYHISRVHGSKGLMPSVFLVSVNSDYWKTETHQRFVMPLDQPGAIALFDVPQQSDHDNYARHLTAEKQVESFVAGRGTVVTWETIRRENHYLDASYGATCAGEFIREVTSKVTTPTRRPTSKVNLSGPDGRSFFVTNR